MTVVCLTNCPPKLRGDLTKWLIEINTGVYVGNISARVRDELWARITENIRSGQATMVYRAAGEQHMDFRVHNTTWKPADYDGLKLMMRPSSAADAASEQPRFADGFSKAAKRRKARQMQRAGSVRASYVVLDMETTGLEPGKDAIIEIAALRISPGRAAEEFSCLVRPERAIPEVIQRLTGITETMTSESGLPLKEALTQLCSFLGTARLVCWNAPFDLAFLQLGCSRSGLSIPNNKADDAMKLARKKLKRLPDYRLTTAAQHYGIDISGAHRALRDCYLTHAVYEKLNEKDAAPE